MDEDRSKDEEVGRADEDLIGADEFEDDDDDEDLDEDTDDEDVEE